jgi:hypothetical protein
LAKYLGSGDHTEHHFCAREGITSFPSAITTMAGEEISKEMVSSARFNRTASKRFLEFVHLSEF